VAALFLEGGTFPLQRFSLSLDPGGDTQGSSCWDYRSHFITSSVYVSKPPWKIGNVQQLDRVPGLGTEVACFEMPPHSISTEIPWHPYGFLPSLMLV